MNRLRVTPFLLAIGFFSLACEPQQDIPDTSHQEISQPSIRYLEGQYVIVLHGRFLNFRKSDAYEEQQESLKKELAPFFKKHNILEEQLGYLYSTALNGFSARLDPDQLKQIQADPWVKYFEPDQAITLNRSLERQNEQETSTQVIPQGIERVRGGKRYNSGNLAFVLDTGIDIEHPDLNVHPNFGFTAFYKLNGNRPSHRQFFNDGHGHGTHVAGTIGAIDNHLGVVGVAAGATLVPVKVMDDRGWGTMSGILAGVDYVGHRGKRGDVANMSIGTWGSDALDEAVINAANRKGIHFVAAAGNSSLPATALSPARITGQEFVVTVAAITHSDVFASWSHYGNPPVDYAAPGVGILSTWRNGTYRWDSGTSMAAPHVAGLLLLGEIGVDGYAINPPDDSTYPIPVHLKERGRR